MNDEEFARLDAAVARVVRAHNNTPEPDDRPWLQDYWVLGHPLMDKVVEPEGYLTEYVEVDCGSGCCLAGDIVIAAGAMPIMPEGKARPGLPSPVFSALHEGKLVSISGLAYDLIGGQDRVESSNDVGLFFEENTAEDIVITATNLAAADGYTLTSKLEDLR